MWPASSISSTRCPTRSSWRSRAGASPATGATHLTNGTLAKLLREYGEKVSGIKEELAGRLAELLVKLYKESEAALTDFFKPGFVRLNGVHGPHPEVFEPPIRDGGLRHSVVALYILKHLRGSRILSPDWENTGYSVEDLAKALIERRVSVEGVFAQAARPCELEGC